MDRKKIERFFQNKCKPVERKEILQWFKTVEGQAFLENKLDQDILNLHDERIKPMTSEVRSKKMWDVIDSATKSIDKDRYQSIRKPTSYWQVVAVVVVLLLVSTGFFVWTHVALDKKKATQLIAYSAANDQQKALTLSDGTEIMLNNNAQIKIPEDFGRANRQVTLEGEAFFKVVHNEKKPFIIHTFGASVKDLGTTFNVRAVPRERNIQVAVTGGKVSVWSDRQTEEEATELVKGQYGRLDMQGKTFRIDKFSVGNYLSWMNGRLKFDRAPLGKVSTQLSRIFDVSFAYSDNSLKQLSLTTNFERGSLEKVLEVISLTLRIDYRRDGQKVVWMPGYDGSK